MKLRINEDLQWVEQMDKIVTLFYYILMDRTKSRDSTKKLDIC